MYTQQDFFDDWFKLLNIQQGDVPSSLIENLLAFYSFDGSSPIIECINNLNGTIVGSPTLTTDKYSSNYAYNNFTTSNYIRADYDEYKFTSAGSFTHSMWCYPTSFPTYSALGGNANDNAGGFHMRFNGNKLASYIQDSSGRGVHVILSAAGDSSSINTWYHCVQVYDASTKTGYLYINGVSKGATTNTSFSGNIWNYTDPASWDPLGYCIGRRGTTRSGYEYPFQGKLSNVTLWTKALTPDEVLELYNTTNAAYTNWCEMI